MSAPIQVLILRLRGNDYAIPIARVIETMRPLETRAIAGSPAFVRGVCVIRGTVTPVVDLGLLLGGDPVDVRRFVTVRVDDSRQLALAAEAVVGVRTVDGSAFEKLPALFGPGGPSIDAVAVEEARLQFLLDGARMIPGDAWSVLLAPRSSG